jgi:hypothetical protein
MVREVIIHPDAIHFAAQLHPSGNPLERAKSLNRVLNRDARMASRSNCCECILHVVRTNQLPLNGTPRPTAFEHLELGEIVNTARRARRP